MKLGFALIAVVLACGALAGCSDDDDGGGTGGTATGGAGGAGGGAGSGGSAGAAGGGCMTCSQMVATAEIDVSKACAGESTTLLTAFLQCTCQDDVCGGAGKGCEAECAGTATSISQACVDCDTTAAGGPCKTQFEACMADQ